MSELLTTEMIKSWQQEEVLLAKEALLAQEALLLVRSKLSAAAIIAGDPSLSRKSKNCILGGGKKELILEVLQNANTPMTPKEIWQAAQKTTPDVSWGRRYMQLYQTLQRLKESELIIRVADGYVLSGLNAAPTGRPGVEG